MRLKVQLQRDVADLGRAGEIVQVSQAQARNFLLPKGLAVIATAKVLAASAHVAAQRQAAVAHVKADVAKLESAVAAATIRLTGRANPQGKLFAALKIGQVVDAIYQQLHLRVPAGAAMEPETVKTLGDHIVTLRVNQSSFTCHMHIDHADH